MSTFTTALKGLSAKRDRNHRRWLYVPYDQLSDELGALSRQPAKELGIVLIESSWKPAQRPYHKQKLAWVLANQRHFALEQAKRGVAVDYRFTERPYGAELERACAQHEAQLEVMEPAERELRVQLQPLLQSGKLMQVPHEGWLTSAEQFASSHKGKPPYRMDAFYRRVRKDTGILMEGGKPIGGKWSHDTANRLPWPGDPPAPEAPSFRVDRITREVGDVIDSRFGEHPGQLDLTTIPARKRDHEVLWTWAQRECLPLFGPYEDAMSTRSRGLFHTRLSPALNLHRLTPRKVLSDVLELDLPLASKEGFVRQLIGWRELVRHVHRVSDGFRLCDNTNHLGADNPLPPAFWQGSPSGLNCLDTVVSDVWETGYSHHITRLMVLSNLATLLDISPRELTDWFWVAYIDAYDWVVEPNVLGMGTFAVGEYMTTKPYVSGAAYINKMSDYCEGCAFDPKQTCPITPLYWAFLQRHAKTLQSVQRLRLPLASASKRTQQRTATDRATFERVRSRLREGEVLSPEPL